MWETPDPQVCSKSDVVLLFHRLLYTTSLSNDHSDIKKKGSSACSHCRSLKVKCEVLPGNTACSKCQASGLIECPPPEPPKDAGGGHGHGLSAPPDSLESAAPENCQPTNQRAPAPTARQPQHVRSQSRPPSSTNVVDPPGTKRQHTRSASQRSVREATVARDPLPSAPSYMAAIPEFDEIYDSSALIQDSTINYDSTGPSIYEADAPNDSSKALDRTDTFFMTLGATDGYSSDDTENFDMNVSGTDREDDDEDGFEARGKGEDEDEDEDKNNVSAPSIEALYARLPRAAIGKYTKPKAVKQSKNASRPSNNNIDKTHTEYDPDKCRKYFLYFSLMQQS
jgi:hypothetical protein